MKPPQFKGAQTFFSCRVIFVMSYHCWYLGCDTVLHEITSQFFFIWISLCRSLNVHSCIFEMHTNFGYTTLQQLSVAPTTGRRGPPPEALPRSSAPGTSSLRHCSSRRSSSRCSAWTRGSKIIPIHDFLLLSLYAHPVQSKIQQKLPVHDSWWS